MEEEADWLRSRGYQRNDFKRELGSYAAGGMVDPMQPGAPPMLGQGQAMPGDADEGFTGMEDDGDYGMGDEGMAMMGGHPLMPPDMGGMLTPDMAMERLAQLPPDQMQVLAMSMADPTIAGAWGTLLGPGFEGLLNMLMQGQGAGMMGGGMGAAPQPQMGGGGMGGYAGGGLVHPSMPQARGGLPAGRPNAAPPGVRPGMSPMKREPVPFQPPRRGMAGVGM